MAFAASSRTNRLNVISLVILTTAACLPVEKRQDAVQATNDPNTASVAKPLSLTLTSRNVESGIARSSGAATLLRLNKLFPNQKTTILPAADFDFEDAVGINRAFGLLNRPFDSLAQTALRAKATQLCALNSSAIFSNSGITVTGDAVPAEEPHRLAWTSARNAWLVPIAKDDPLVLELKALAEKATADGSAEGGVAGARKAVCMAALLAPEFWMGTHFKSDAAKRMALEVFQTIPNLADLKKIEAGQLTLAAYFDQLEKDPAATNGLKAALRGWHREWLGLRDQLAISDMQDSRPGLVGGPSGISDMVGLTYTNETLPGVGPDTLQAASIAGTMQAGKCTADQAQAFEPDSKMLLWQHKNYDTNTNSFVGGWVRIGLASASPAPSLQAGTSANLAYMKRGDVVGKINDLLPAGLSATGKDLLLNDLCTTGTEVTDARGHRWRMCSGWLELKSASTAEVNSTLNGLLDFVVDRNTKSTAVDARCNGKTGADLAKCTTDFQAAWTRERNNLILEFLNVARRLRRYGDTGKLDATLHTELATIPGAAKAGEPTASDAAYFTEFVNRVAKLRTLSTTLANLITSESNWGFRVEMNELAMPVGVTGGLSYPTNLHWSRFSASIGNDSRNGKTPILDRSVPASPKFLAADRRLRRLAASGTWQDGYSKVRLWHSDREVNVCNAFDRFPAACYLRAGAALPGGNAATGFRANAAAWWTTFNAWNPDSLGHPAILGHFYCHTPASFPGPTTSPADRVAPFKTAFSSDGSSANTKAFAMRLVLSAPPADAASLQAEKAILGEISSQAKDEPYRLIEKIVLERKSYKELLTADYTVGTPCLEAFYLGQGLYLPPNSRASKSCTAGAPATSFSTGEPIPFADLTNSSSAAGPGAVQNASGPRTAMWTANNTLATGSLPARVYSGIVTMPAFLTPVATKNRGTSARFFTRLLCTEPNFYNPTSETSKLDLHRSFISGRRHLRPECILCHQNLDPLGSALAWSFKGLLNCNTANGECSNTAGGEGGPRDILGELDQIMFGTGGTNLPGTGITSGGGPKSRGAFMGKEVTGIKELADAVASSDQFAGCVTETVFTYVFGRKPQITDAEVVKGFVTQFKSPQSAGGVDYRYLDLIKAMVTSDHFKRNN